MMLNVLAPRAAAGIAGLVLGAFSVAALAQGPCPGTIVPNSGFEDFTGCPTGVGQMTVNTWFSATNGTPDYFNFCAASTPVGVPSSWFGFEWGHGLSNGYVGFAAYSQNGEYREYVETILWTPLKPNTIYEVSFYVSLADGDRFAVADIGAYLSIGPLQAPIGTALGLVPHAINTSGPITRKSGNAPDYGWTRVCCAYNSGNGGQDYITIGNFAHDADTTVVDVGTGSSAGSYYFLDDVCVRECTVAPAFGLEPSDQSVALCDGATFTADGGCGVLYQWYVSCGGPPSKMVNTPGLYTGVDTQSLKLTPAAALSLNGCVFSVTATNQCGVATSQGATLTVDTQPVVTPAQLAVCPPEPASLTVQISGTGLKYQWYRKCPGSPPVAIPGGTKATLNGNYPGFWPPQTRDCDCEYYCTVGKPGCGFVESTHAILICCDCEPPPSNMALWLPFDQVLGNPPRTRNIIPRALPGFLLPTGATTNYLQGQYVGNSLFFYGDGYVRVQNNSLIDITDGDLSVDAWVMQDGNLPARVSVITDKRLENWEAGQTHGYHLFLQGDDTGNCQIGFQLADGAHTNWVSNWIPTFYGWHHIAVTVDRDDPSGGRFYYDGQQVGAPFNPTSRQGSLSNPSPFTVAARSTSPSGFYVGGIDEVEVFRRALRPSEVSAIFAANGVGKCKQFCQIPRTYIFCKDAVSTPVEAYVVNFTPASVVFGGSFDQLLCPYTPLNFPVTASVPIKPWSWDVASASAIAPDMNLFGSQDTCFLASFTAPGVASFSCGGVIVNRPDITCSSGSETLLTLPLGESGSAVLGFGNAGILSGVFAYRVEAIGPDGQTSGTLSINGAPPGWAIQGQASIPVGSEFELTLEVRFDEVDALGFTTLLLSTDTEGNGNFVPAASVALVCEVPSSDICPSDFDGSGFVDLDDFASFVLAFEAGTDNADFDGTGFIDLDDYIAFVAAFEAGC